MSNSQKQMNLTKFDKFNIKDEFECTQTHKKSILP